MPDNFLPSSRAEIEKLGWAAPDIILITGDAYVDHPSFGTAVIGRYLESFGYRVAICDAVGPDDVEKIKSFGIPRLYYGVSSGNVDSSLMRYTAFNKIRNDDPFLPESLWGRRPERAVIMYCNLIKQITKEVPIVIGGIEASMRRFFHYDFASGKARRSLLLDSRADVLVYGSGEFPCLECARRIEKNMPLDAIAGTVVMRADAVEGSVIVESEEEVLADKKVFADCFAKIYTNKKDVICQPSAKRFIVQYPHTPMQTQDLDYVYSLPFTRRPALKYVGMKIAAFDMIRFSVNSHRGCASGCAFCSLAMHQGRRIVSRSEKSCIDEAQTISIMDYFKGHITDVGGPSANMYRTACSANWECRRESCLYPSRCKNLKTQHARWAELMRKISELPKIKHVTVGSGIRYDLLMHDDAHLLDEIVSRRVSGQMKVAPEHTEDEVLDVMRKKPVYPFEKFVAAFEASCARTGVKRYIVPYLMSNHPGCTEQSMKRMRTKLSRTLKFMPEQVQSFIPLPGTLSSVIYYTGFDPLTGEKIFSEHDRDRRRRQHEIFFR